MDYLNEQFKIRGLPLPRWYLAHNVKDMLDNADKIRVTRNPIPPASFFLGIAVVSLNNTTYEARLEDEPPFLHEVLWDATGELGVISHEGGRLRLTIRDALKPSLERAIDATDNPYEAERIQDIVKSSSELERLMINNSLPNGQRIYESMLLYKPGRKPTLALAETHGPSIRLRAPLMSRLVPRLATIR